MDIDELLENEATRHGMLESVRSGKRAVLLYVDDDGNWRSSWLNMRQGDMTYASSILQKEVMIMMLSEEEEDDK